MEIIYSPQAIEDIKYWKTSGNKNIQKKIATLILAISKDPYTSIGKPEALKHELTGFWSRRINKEHRIVYKVINNQIRIEVLKGHYL